MATNIIGDSIISQSGSGAKIIQIPDAPLNLAEDTSQRSSSTLGLTWNAGSSDGGSTLMDYRISIAVQGQAFNVLDSTPNTNYVATGLTAGVTYELKVEAQN